VTTNIGLGSDFDGISTVPVGLEDVSRYPALTAELVRRGYADEDVRRILGLILLRVMRTCRAGRRRHPLTVRRVRLQPDRGRGMVDAAVTAALRRQPARFRSRAVTPHPKSSSVEALKRRDVAAGGRVGRSLILETSFLVDLEREHNRGALGPAIAFLEANSEARLYLPFIVAGELAAGTSLAESTHPPPEAARGPAPTSAVVHAGRGLQMLWFAQARVDSPRAAIHRRVTPPIERVVSRTCGGVHLASSARAPERMPARP